MNSSYVSCVQLRGQLHRPRYEGGSLLKCTIFAEHTCATNKGEGKGDTPAERTMHDGPHNVVPHRSLNIERILIQVIGLCTVDTSRIVCPRGTFGDELLGAGKTHANADDTCSVASGSSKGTKGIGFFGGLFSGWRGQARNAEGEAQARQHTPTEVTIIPELLSGLATDGAGSRYDEPHVVFATPAVLIASKAHLNCLDICTAIFRCKLPPNLPPSFSGYCARYQYTVHVVCEYSVHPVGTATINGDSSLSHRRGSSFEPAIKERATKYRQTLRIPLKVDSSLATCAIIRSPYVPTNQRCSSPALLTAHSKLENTECEGVNTNECLPSGQGNETDSFDFKIQHTFLVSSNLGFLKPSPVLAPPIEDALFCNSDVLVAANLSSSSTASSSPPSVAFGAVRTPSPCEIGIRSPNSRDGKSGNGGVHSELSATTQERKDWEFISTQFPAQSIGIGESGGDLSSSFFQVRVLLRDTAVRVGEQLRGVIRCFPPPPISEAKERGGAPWVCVRVVATLEVIESAPRAFFRQGSVIPKDCEDESSFVVANCATVAEAEYILHAPSQPAQACQKPFALSLNGPRCQQSARTDIISNKWRIKFAFFFASAANVAQAVERKGEAASVVPISESIREVSLPVTVLPPLTPKRLGPMAFCEKTMAL